MFWCKSTPLEFETFIFLLALISPFLCKSTPLEFETFIFLLALISPFLCKSTPLEFETIFDLGRSRVKIGVNLLRWSLKPYNLDDWKSNKRV